jgi:hypothetical protein
VCQHEVLHRHAKDIRDLTLIILGVHAVLGIAGAVIIDFAFLFGQIMYCLILYSIYLTLRIWLISFYLIILAMNVASGVLIVFDHTGFEIIAYSLVLVFYCADIYYYFKKTSEFRASTIEGNYFYFEVGLNHMTELSKELLEDIKCYFKEI